VAAEDAAAVCVAVGVCEAVAGWEDVAVREAGAVREALAEPDGPAPFPEALSDARVVGDGGALAVPLNRSDDGAVTVGPALTEGEKIGGTDEVPLVQAVTDAEKTTVAVAQPAAVSLALLTFMRPPYIPRGQRP
jgi:hypothetical protein